MNVSMKETPRRRITVTSSFQRNIHGSVGYLGGGVGALLSGAPPLFTAGFWTDI
jgi:hypothetical protein